MEKDLPDWKQQLSKGNFKDIKQWLVKNVHTYGNLYDPADLIKKITGAALGVKPYLNYLKDKYSKLYDF
jgi:carboxypeptidase Taq